MNQNVTYKRLLLKLSGETLMGEEAYGIDYPSCLGAAKAIKGIRDSGMELGVVIGGGNVLRGINLNDAGMERTPADQMGMLATLINGIALQQALKALGCEARVMTALECPRVAEAYNWRLAHEYLSQGIVVIFVGGTGNPYFTTDTASALRASEIHADIFLKATKVDGIYDKDPLKYPDAVKFDTISYEQALKDKLKVMDATAFALCRSNAIPIFVFNMERLEKHSIIEILQDKRHGTLVTGE